MHFNESENTSSDNSSIMETANFSTQVCDILSNLIKLSLNPSKQEVPDKLQGLLRDMALLMNCDRAFVFILDDQTSFSAIHTWHTEMLPDNKKALQKLSLKKYAFWEKFIANPKIIQFNDISCIPEIFSKDRQLLNNLDIKSMIQVPMLAGEIIQGFILFSSSSEEVKSDRIPCEVLNSYSALVGKTVLENSNIKAIPEKSHQLNVESLFKAHPALLEKIFSEMDLGIAFFDTSINEFVYLNSRFSELFGFSNLRYFKKSQVFKMFKNNGYDTDDFFSPKTSLQKKDFSFISQDKYIQGYVHPVSLSKVISITLNDISPVTNAEKDEKDFNHQLRILSEAALKFINFKNENIWEFIGETAYSLLRNGIVVVNWYNHNEKHLQTKYVRGFGIPMDLIISLLGKHPMHRTYPLEPNSELYDNMCQSPFTQLHSGYTELSLGAIPPNVSRQLEKITGTCKYYACGLSVEGKLYGTITLMLRKGTTVRPFILETLSRMISTALHTLSLSSELEKTTSILSHTTKIAKMGYWQYDYSSNKILLSKDLIAELFGRRANRDTILPFGLFVNRFVDAHDAAIITEKIETAKDKPEGFADEYEWKLHRKNHEPQIIYSRGENQKGGWLLGIAKDITHEKLKLEREKQIEIRHHAASAKQMFLENMSHEMRTPLNGIIGMTDILMHSGLNIYQKDLLSVIKESSDSLLELISNIHELSRIEADRIIVQHNSFNPTIMLRKTVDIFKAAALQKKITLDYSINTDPQLCLTGDEFRLQQILTNLIGNALKFTPEQGSVQVDASLKLIDEDFMDLKIMVKDTGIGIPEEKIPYLFEKFNQADNSYTREYEGIGIGLSISKELINLMGGSIGLSSKCNQGSEFWINIVLPLCKK
jgi:signal transduction histidine kinase